jgi:hypothetical protein
LPSMKCHAEPRKSVSFSVCNGLFKIISLLLCVSFPLWITYFVTHSIFHSFYLKHINLSDIRISFNIISQHWLSDFDFLSAAANPHKLYKILHNRFNLPTNGKSSDLKFTNMQNRTYRIQFYYMERTVFAINEYVMCMSYKFKRINIYLFFEVLLV